MSHINLLRALKHMHAKDHEERISIEKYNKEIDEAEERIKKDGEFFTHDEVTKMSKEW